MSDAADAHRPHKAHAEAPDGMDVDIKSDAVAAAGKRKRSSVRPAPVEEEDEEGVEDDDEDADADEEDEEDDDDFKKKSKKKKTPAKAKAPKKAAPQAEGKAATQRVKKEFTIAGQRYDTPPEVRVVRVRSWLVRAR